MLFDSHAHTGMMQDAGGTDAVIARARSAGITGIMAIGGNDEMNTAALTVAASEPGMIRAALGFDRDEAVGKSAPLSGFSPQVSALRNEIEASREIVAAIGEIGLDFHYHPENAKEQEDLFNRQLALASELHLPVVVHSREAEDATLSMLCDHSAAWNGSPERLGVLHCFTGTYEFARKLVDLGYHISFSGIITFRNAQDLREVASRIPSERLLIETDSPYLAPVPHRGKTNEPAFLLHVAQKLAEIRGVSTEEIAQLTTANAQRLFAFAPSPPSA